MCRAPQLQPTPRQCLLQHSTTEDALPAALYADEPLLCVPANLESSVLQHPQSEAQDSQGGLLRGKEEWVRLRGIRIGAGAAGISPALPMPLTLEEMKTKARTGQSSSSSSLSPRHVIRHFASRNQHTGSRKPGPGDAFQSAPPFWVRCVFSIPILGSWGKPLGKGRLGKMKDNEQALSSSQLCAIWWGTQVGAWKTWAMSPALLFAHCAGQATPLVQASFPGSVRQGCLYT